MLGFPVIHLQKDFITEGCYEGFHHFKVFVNKFSIDMPGNLKITKFGQC